MNTLDLATRYDASLTEAKWYAAWEEAGLFQPQQGGRTFCITIPPPNITGSLHMGHALCYPLQDAVGRFRRLKGDRVLVLPGQDHAGIATQSVVDKMLRKEGKSAAALGREEFVKRVWEWRDESGGTISRQLRTLGCAFDWPRQRFTLDEGYVRAVLQVFINWFERGLIYRGKRVVNWDPKLKTSVSDIETERRIDKGKLYYVRYPFEDASGEVVIATTRPETMLGDVAVAVHPSDTRYHGLVGKNLILPLMDRPIPLIADLYPDPSFGSGAVKITPAHDPNDYEVGVRHNLDMPMMLDEDAKITAIGGPYAGLDRYEARKRIVADLEERGYLIKIEDYSVPLIVSERSHEVIEPLLSEQWFVRQTELAPAVIAAVEEGRTTFVPDRYRRIFLDWMENIKDWCISRQLWWGHRIPVYYDDEGRAFAAHSWAEAQEKAGARRIVRQDDDVLDTWFSSGLWPFATLGWPETNAGDLMRFYPTNVLITDRNIINLWVARMMMMGIDQMGVEPFHEVMIYATVMTEDGRRMSKSLGTGVDPMGVIEKSGADSLRFTLMSQTGQNQEIRYSERRTEDARNFCNKIWNATRFVLMNLGDQPPTRPAELDIVDRWLLSRLAASEREVSAGYEAYDLQGVCQSLYRFFWNDLCDWYIEISKTRLADPALRNTPQWVLLQSLQAFLVMLHPIMPFISEELYGCLPVADKSRFVMTANWPELPETYVDTEAEASVERAFAITRALRALRAELDLAAMRKIPVAHFEGDLGGLEWIVASQAWAEQLVRGKPEGKFLATTLEGVDLFLPLGADVDVEKVVSNLEREQENLRADRTKLAARLANPDFVNRAKPEVVGRDRALVAEIDDKIAKIASRLALFRTPS